MLHTLPGGSVVLDGGEQVVLVGTGEPRGIGQAPEIGSHGVDASRQVSEACVEAVKQDGTPKLGRLE